MTLKNVDKKNPNKNYLCVRYYNNNILWKVTRFPKKKYPEYCRLEKNEGSISTLYIFKHWMGIDRAFTNTAVTEMFSNSVIANMKFIVFILSLFV